MAKILNPLQVGSLTIASVLRYRFENCVRYTSSGSKLKTLFKELDGGVDTKSDTYVKNAASTQKIHLKHKDFIKLINEGGGEKARQRHTEKNKKLLVHDRLRLLFDNVEDVLEIGMYAGLGMKYGNIPRAGQITAIGKIQGVYCLVSANDATVKGGTIFPISVRKQLRAQDIAEENRLPCIYLTDSGGAFLPLQADVFNVGGRTFYNEAIMNSKNIPQLSVVCGSCTAGAAYIPTMAQEALIVSGIGTIFLGGPPLVFAALGEVVSPEQLGGAKMHSSVSGCTDHFAETEEEALATSRDIVATFNIPPAAERGAGEYAEPAFDPLELEGIIPETDQHTMDIYKVIARVVDGSRFQEFKKLYGPTLVTGFAFIQGHLVGVVGSRGGLSAEAALKGAHFVAVCSQRDVPLVFLQNAAPQPTDAEDAERGLLRAHAKLMASVACAQVPKLTVVVGDSVGASNYMMCGRSFDPRFLFSWPNAKFCGAEPGLVVRESVREAFPDPDARAGPQFDDFVKKVNEKVAMETSAFHASAKIWDDGVILPQDTRQVLGKCLEIVKQVKCLPQGQVESSILRM